MSLETMTKLATTTVGAGGVGSVTFSTIPQGYTDLVIKVSARSNQSNVGYTALRFNGSSTGYTQRILQADGSTTTSYSGVAGLIYALTASTTNSTIWDSTDIYIPNYTSSNYKSISFDNVVDNGTSSNSFTFLSGGLWSDTSAINSITLYAMSSSVGLDKTFQQYSTFTLYGVKAARTAVGNSIKASGGNISFDGTYVYHTFNTTSSFIPTTGLIADYLVVAGGGGAGDSRGSGGGAGGYLTSLDSSPLSLTAGISYAVTIGAGGTTGAFNSGNPGTAGSNSVFSSITATGGGFGRGSAGGIGGTGGSGGGSVANATGGSATSGQGYAGGAGQTGAEPYGAGGGGGAGAVGSAGTSTYGGAGGAGRNTNSAWATATGTGHSGYFAGGGGGGIGGIGTAGGLGGAGGGGNGGQTADSVGVAGTANTGGGGGGGKNTTAGQLGGAGGSGIVIVRYKA